MTNEEIVIKLNNKDIALDDRFITTCVLVDALKPLGLIAQSQELKFYGPYKQAIFGKCNEKAPLMLRFAASVKWDEWHNQGNISKDEAKQNYINYALKVFENISSDEKVINMFKEITPEILKKRCEEKRSNIDQELKKKTEEKIGVQNKGDKITVKESAKASSFLSAYLKHKSGANKANTSTGQIPVSPLTQLNENKQESLQRTIVH